MKISALSKEYVKVEVTHWVAGAAVDPTADPVSLAFVVPGTAPVTNDWVTGSWDTGNGAYWARCIVGPGGKALTAGLYAIWVKVTDNPEVPVLLVDGLLQVA